MSGYVVPEVWCDGCPSKATGDQDQTVAQLRAELAEDGWTATDDDDRCADCNEGET